MNKVRGYRNMIMKSQDEVALRLGICRETFGKKERGKGKFNIKEMQEFTAMVKEHLPDVTMEDIFLN